jgi:GntR family transcriptional regulator
MTGGQRGVIDRRSLLPFYEQLRAILVDRLSTEWQTGDRLPSEGDLCAHYGVSRTVVRQALDQLTAEGLIHKVKGRGAFVVERRLEATFVQRTGGFYEEMTRRGHDVSSQVLRQEVIAAPVRVAAQLDLPIGDPVVQLDRLRFVDQQPIQVVRSTLPHRLVPGLATVDLTDRSLYAVLRQRYGISGSSGKRTLWASGAAAEDAKLLKMKAGSPVLMVQSISTSSYGVPFEWFVATYSGDRAQFDVDVVTPARKET